MWGKRYTHTLLVELKIGATITESGMEIPQKTWNGTTIWPSSPTPKLIPKLLKSSYYSDKDAWMFIAARFTNAKPWNQPRCPSIDEFVKEMCCIYIMEYYSTLKKYKMMAFAGKRMELENIMLSKINHKKKRSNVFYDMCMLIHNRRRGGDKGVKKWWNKTDINTLCACMTALIGWFCIIYNKRNENLCSSCLQWVKMTFYVMYN